jgi:hypothetical protein
MANDQTNRHQLNKLAVVHPVSRTPYKSNALFKNALRRYTPPRLHGVERLATNELTPPRRHALDTFWAIAYGAAFLQMTDERIELGRLAPLCHSGRRHVLLVRYSRALLRAGFCGKASTTRPPG